MSKTDPKQTDPKPDTEANEKDLDLTTDQADRVKGGMYPVEGGGGNPVRHVSKTKHHKAKHHKN